MEDQENQKQEDQELEGGEPEGGEEQQEEGVPAPKSPLDPDVGEPEEEGGAVPPDMPLPDQAESNSTESQDSGNSWQELLHDKKLIYSTIAVFTIIVVAVLTAYFFVFSQEQAPPAPDINFTAETVEKTPPYKQFDIKVNIANTTNHELRDLELKADFPRDFEFTKATQDAENDKGDFYELENLAAGASQEIIITGVLNGQVGDKKEFNFELRYKIPGFSNVYTDKTSATVEIEPSSISLNVAGPVEIIRGQELTYDITYRNVSKETLNNIIIAVDLPTDFRISSSNPTISGSGTWTLNSLRPNEEGNLRLVGSYTSSSPETKTLTITANEASDEEEIITKAFIVTKVSDSPLLVTQTLVSDNDGVVLAGETMRYRLVVENRGEETYSNLILSTDLIGGAYDFNSLQTQDGALANRTITWSPGGVNDLRLLQPNNKVEVEFSIKVSNPPTRFGEKNLTLTSTPKVTAQELRDPIPGQRIEVKIKGSVDLAQKVEYSSGANPPRVGSPTEYKITWTVANTVNTVRDIRITADLPLDGFSGGQAASDTSLSHNASAQILTWDIGRMEPHSTKTATFTITYTPSVTDQGKTLILINNIDLGAYDVFVEQPVFDETPVRDAKSPNAVQG